MKTKKARVRRANKYPIDRAKQMLAIAAYVIREHCPEATYGYDGTVCDGGCIADDCEAVAEALAEHTPSITELLGVEKKQE